MSPPAAQTAQLDLLSDAELITAVRSGDTESYGVLFRRHSGSARALARQLTTSAAEIDDLVAEAFVKVLATLRTGGGPDAAFRAYLLTSLRHASYDRAHRDRRLELSDDMARHDPGVPWEDPAVAGLESTLAARAFRRLPERWQTVLWHTEIERESPAAVAPLLGMTPNGVAALAYRAREGLRQAYLQEHLSDGVQNGHRATAGKLGAWTRGGLSARHRAQVDAHLATCDRCRALAAELRDVNGGLRGVVAPLVLGSGAAGYLASQTGGGTGAATAALTAAGGQAGATVAASQATVAVTGGAGSAIGAGSAWLVGTHAGQVAVAAVIVGSSLAGVAALTDLPGSPARPVLAAPATERGPVASDLPAPGEYPGGPVRTSPAATTGAPTSGAAGPSRTAEPSGRPTSTGTPAPSSPEPTPTPTPSTTAEGGTAAPDTSPGTGPATSPALLWVGSPVVRRPLVNGRPGELAVTVRNDGAEAATDLVATVSLPQGLTVRPGGSQDPDGWQCSGTGAVATCRAAALPAGAEGTIRIRIFVGDTAAAGTGTEAGTETGADTLGGIVGGTVTAAGAGTVAIPTALLEVGEK